MNNAQSSENNLRHQDVWNGSRAGLRFKICHWGVDELINDGKGVWNYYVFIHEGRVPKEVFESIWLPDVPYRLIESSPERIRNEYDTCKLAEVYWHGGITYYRKHGHSEGHRCIEAGCDFDHLWDHERGGDYDLAYVHAEAQQTCSELAKLLSVKQEAK